MNPNLSHTFVAVAGNIGAGKSTLTQMLAREFGWQPFMEANDDNPYLADFYSDMSRWSFHSQVFFLSQRLEHHRKLADYPGSVIQDRTVYEDAEIFARNLYAQATLSWRDWETYSSLYRAVSAFLPHPNLVIYLRASVDTLMRQIQKRGREYERDIRWDYVERLNNLYESWIDGWTLSDVLIIDMDECDFQNRASDFANVCNEVRGRLSLPAW